MMGTGIPIDRMNDERLKKFLEDHKDELDTLAAMSDEDIDFSDIPEMTDEEWQAALKRGVYRPAMRDRRAVGADFPQECQPDRPEVDIP